MRCGGRWCGRRGRRRSEGPPASPRVGLPRRMRRREGGQRRGAVGDRRQHRIGREVHLVAPRVEHRGHQADIRLGHRVAPAERAVPSLHRQRRLEAPQALGGPVAVPFDAVGLAQPPAAAQFLQHAQVRHRVDVAGHHLAQAADHRPLPRALRQQGRRGVRLLQVVQQGEGLRQRGLALLHQRGQGALRVQRHVGVGAVLALRQGHGAALPGQALPVERDPQPVGGGGAEIPVQDHGGEPSRSASGSATTQSSAIAQKAPPPNPA